MSIETVKDKAWLKQFISSYSKPDQVLETYYPTDQVYAIGDVHGCAEEFEELLKQIRDKHPNAVIYQLGDLIDRGPYLLEVFQVCEKYNVELIMGNHEYNFWLELCSGKECRSEARRNTHEQFQKLKAKYKDFILDKISSAQNFRRIQVFRHFDGGDVNARVFYLTHAPVTQRVLNSLNSGVMNFCMTSQDDHKFPQKLRNNIHGHTHWKYQPIEEQLTEQALFNSCYNINLDSGLVYGGCLTALNLVDFSFIQVPSKKVYFEE